MRKRYSDNKWQERFEVRYENMLNTANYYYLYDKLTKRAQWWNGKWDRTFYKRRDAIRSAKMKLYWEKRKIEEMLLG